jgi:hypothetical protein
MIISVSNNADSHAFHDFAESRPDQWRDVELKYIFIYLLSEQREGKA